jgi:putative hydrolase of the HAD superfamily
MPKIAIVFFDLGGVVARFIPQRRTSALLELAGGSAHDLDDRIWNSGLFRDFDSGRYSADSMYEKLCEVLGVCVPREQLLHAWSLAFEVSEAVLSVASALRSRIRVGLLTNNPPLLLEALPLHFPKITSTFDPIIFSCELGLLKVDPECYASVARMVELPTNQIVLLDDSLANVEGAREAGWQAIHFSTSNTLKQTLTDLGLTVT